MYKFQLKTQKTFIFGKVLHILQLMKLVRCLNFAPGGAQEGKEEGGEGEEASKTKTQLSRSRSTLRRSSGQNECLSGPGRV